MMPPLLLLWVWVVRGLGLLVVGMLILPLKYGDWIRESVITYIIYLMNDWQPLTSWLGRK